jgi:hypothetical protein
MNYDLWKSTVPPDEAPTLGSSPVVCVGGCGHRGGRSNFAEGRWCWSCWSQEHRRRLETEAASGCEGPRESEDGPARRADATQEEPEDA